MSDFVKQLWSRARSLIVSPDKSGATLGARVALGLTLFAATGFLAYSVNANYAIKAWLFWRYAIYWCACLLLTITCLSVGNLLVSRVLRRNLPLLEHVVVSLTVGLYLFELAMFLAGMFGLYRKALFMALPLALTTLGAPALWKWGRRAHRHLRFARTRQAPLPWWQLPAIGVGLLSLFAVYFVLLTPENVQFDARWKHLALAEEYVAAGGIERFPIGMAFATRGHFSSFLYTWAFLLPRGQLFDHMVLSQHLEFVVFLWTTMLGIPAMIRRMAPRADLRLVWVARFIFPGVLVYDSSLSAGADHLGAAFCPAIFLLLLHVYRHLSMRSAILLCMMISGAAMVKETIALMIVPGAVLAIAYRTVTMGIASFRGTLAPALRRKVYLTPLVSIAACLVFTAPHWLHNWVWYGNPVYPIASAYFPSRPWTADADYMLKYGYAEYQFWRPERSIAGVVESLKATASFSFAPHNYKSYIGSRPVFGSLFTLSIATLPFLRHTRRIWTTVVWVHLAVFIWYWVHHQDRYLQGLMPFMAASTGATFVLVWRHGRSLVRTAMIALIALQVVWGADAYFLHRHAMSVSSIKRVVDLLASGNPKTYETRLTTQASWVTLGKQLPRDARVLLHENHNHLGLARVQISDWATYQFGLSYGLLDSPAQVYDKYRELGVTHMHWRETSRSWDSLKADIMFYYFVEKYGAKMGRYAGGTLAAMPSAAPTEPMPEWVLMLGCGRPFRSGVYHLNDMHVPGFGPQAEAVPMPRTVMVQEADAADLAEGADFVVSDPRCATRFADTWQRTMRRLFTRQKVPKLKNPQFQVWIRSTLLSTAPPIPRRPGPTGGEGSPPDGEPPPDEEPADEETEPQ